MIFQLLVITNHELYHRILNPFKPFFIRLFIRCALVLSPKLLLKESTIAELLLFESPLLNTNVSTSFSIQL